MMIDIADDFNNVDPKEEVINSILSSMSIAVDTIRLQMLDKAVRKSLHGYDLIRSCTELSTDLDNTEYVISCFVANKKLEGCVDTTLDQYVRTIRRCLFQCNKSYKNITKDDIKYYLAVRSGYVNRNTLGNDRRNLSSFFTWLHDEGYISKNPVKPVKSIKGEDVEILYFSVEEEIAIRDVQCNKRDKALIAFLFSTGVRVGEVRNMNRSDVDLVKGEVTFRGEKSRIGKYRTVYLDPKSKKYLGEYLATRNDNSPVLFASIRVYNGERRRLTTNAIEKITHRVVEEAGIKDRKKGTVHIFRRTFATRLASHGCPVEVIQELMGHADPGTTLKHYVAKTKERMQRTWESYFY